MTPANRGEDKATMVQMALYSAELTSIIIKD